MSKTNRVAIVTGSSSGIGAATAKLLARQGWHVAINYVRNGAKAEEVAESCRSHGADVLVQQANVARDADCQALVKATEAKWGRVDTLVNNAGTTRFCAHGDLDGLDADDFHDIYAVNVVGAYQMIRAVAPPMQRDGFGSVVNVASIAGVRGVGSSVAYAASKGALITMTKSLARALSPALRINAVCPGFVQGRWLAEGVGEERYNAVITELESKTPLGRICTTDDVAESIAYFAGGAILTTGETLIMDGGAHLGDI